MIGFISSHIIKTSFFMSFSCVMLFFTVTSSSNTIPSSFSYGKFVAINSYYWFDGLGFVHGMGFSVSNKYTANFRELNPFLEIIQVNVN